MVFVVILFWILVISQKAVQESFLLQMLPQKMSFISHFIEIVGLTQKCKSYVGWALDVICDVCVWELWIFNFIRSTFGIQC
jgi:hypothetical protein